MIVSEFPLLSPCKWRIKLYQLFCITFKVYITWRFLTFIKGLKCYQLLIVREENGQRKFRRKIKPASYLLPGSLGKKLKELVQSADFWKIGKFGISVCGWEPFLNRGMFSGWGGYWTTPITIVRVKRHHQNSRESEDKISKKLFFIIAFISLLLLLLL